MPGMMTSTTATHGRRNACPGDELGDSCVVWRAYKRPCNRVVPPPRRGRPAETNPGTIAAVGRMGPDHCPHCDAVECRCIECGTPYRLPSPQYGCLLLICR